MLSLIPDLILYSMDVVVKDNKHATNRNKQFLVLISVAMVTLDIDSTPQN